MYPLLLACTSDCYWLWKAFLTYIKICYTLIQHAKAWTIRLHCGSYFMLHLGLTYCSLHNGKNWVESECHSNEKWHSLLACIRYEKEITIMG